MVVQQGGSVAIFDLNEELGQQTAQELGGTTRSYVVNVVDERVYHRTGGIRDTDDGRRARSCP